MTLRAVYVEQFGYFWRLTPSTWRDLCERAAAGGSFDLDAETVPLRVRPGRLIEAVDWGEGSLQYVARDPGIRLVQPLDWEPDDFASELAELNKNHPPTTT